MTLTLSSNIRTQTPTMVQHSSGMTIIAEQVPIDVVNLNLWFQVGSVCESDNINGMAHFLEHMMFKGTPSLESGKFEQKIEERGGITNAATSLEYTHYYLTCAPQDFQELTPYQLDIVCNPIIPDEAFARERSVVLEEIRRSEDNPRRRLYYGAMEICFEHLPYRRPVLGTIPLIEALKPQQMRDFHQCWYQPSALTAVAVGNLPVEQLIDSISASFQKLYRQNPSSFSAHLPYFQPETPFGKIIRQEESDDRLQQARLVMMWRVPGLTALAETYGLDVLAVILGQGKLSRLFRTLREEKGFVSSISASNITQKVQGTFSISAQLPSENLAIVEQAIVEEIRRIQENGIQPAELQRVCTQVAHRFIFNSERPSDRANLYGYYYSQLQTLEPALTYPQIIESLTPELIQKTAQRYLLPEAYGIFILRP